MDATLNTIQNKRYLFHSCDYEKVNDVPIVLLRARGEDRKDLCIRDPTFRPEFYVWQSERDNLDGTDLEDRIILKEDMGILGTDHNKVTKLVMRLPEDVKKARKLRDDFGNKVFTTTYQSKILFPYVYLVDKDLYHYFNYKDGEIVPIDEDPAFQIKLRKFNLDIETGGNEEAGYYFEDATAPITVIGLIDNYNDTYYQWYYYPPLLEEHGASDVHLTKEWKCKLKESVRKKYPQLADHPHVSDWHESYYDDESDMLNAFLSWWQLNYPDVISGWFAYGGTKKDEKRRIFRPGFDFPYIIRRIKKIGLDQNRLSPFGSAYVFKNGRAVIKGIQLFDSMYGLHYWSRKDPDGGLGLNNCGRRFIKMGKIALPKRISRLSGENPQISSIYNIRDVEIDYLLDESQELTKKSHDLVRLFGVKVEDALQATRVHTISVLREAKGDWILEQKEGQSRPKGVLFKGGHVVEPKVGVHSYLIAKIDLSRAYPYAEIDWNVSPETKFRGNQLVKLFDIAINNLCVSPTGIWFWKHPKGIVPKVYTKLLNLRASYKRERDRVLKEVKDTSHFEYKYWKAKEYIIKPPTNSLYGALGMPGFILFDEDCAGSTTGIVRHIIQHSQEILEDLGVECLMGDTDSLAFRVPHADYQEAFLFIYAVLKILNESYQSFKKKFNIDKVRTKIDLEKVSRSMIFVTKKDSETGAKKKYSEDVIWENGTFVNPEEPELTGFAAVKGNTPQFSKDLQTFVLKKLHELAAEGAPEYKMKEEVLSIIRRSNEILQAAPIDYIGVKLSLKRNLWEYKGKVQHATAMKYSIRHLGQKWRLNNSGKLIYVENIDTVYPETENGVLVVKNNRLPDHFKINIDETFERIGWGMIGEISKLVGIERSETLWKGSFSQGVDNAFYI